MVGAFALYLFSLASQRSLAWSGHGTGIMLHNGWLIVMIGDVAAYGRRVAQLEALHAHTRWTGRSATWYGIKGLRALSNAIAARGQWAGVGRAPHIVYLWARVWLVFITLGAGFLTLFGLLHGMRRKYRQRTERV